MIRLADVVTPRVEKAIPKDFPDLPFVGLDDIEAHTMRLLGTKPAIKLKSSAKRFYPGDVLYSRLRPYLNKVWCADRPGICSSEFIVLPGNDLIDPKFLTLRLNASDFVSFANSLNAGDRPRVDFKQISSFFLPPFSLKRQRQVVAKIEALFSELDKGVESLKTAREQLKIYRQAVLKHAFEGKLTAHWREENADKLESPEQLLARIQHERETRYQQQLQEWKSAVKGWEKNGKEGKKPSKPKHKEISKLSAEELSLLPKLPPGYFYTYLSNLGELGRGKSKHRPRNAPELFGGKYPFIQTGEVKAANRAIKTYSQTYNETGLAQSHLWPKGTLCITIAANIAETAFLGIDACFPDSVVGFTALESVVLPEYVDFFIKAVRVQIEAYAPATAQKNINLATLENLVIPLCSAAEQRCLVDKIEALLSVADKNEAEIEVALRQAETLRQSILKKVFSGKLVF